MDDKVRVPPGYPNFSRPNHAAHVENKIQLPYECRGNVDFVSVPSHEHRYTDIYAIQKSGTASGCVEITKMSGSHAFSEAQPAVVTGLPASDEYSFAAGYTKKRMSKEFFTSGSFKWVHQDLYADIIAVKQPTAGFGSIWIVSGESGHQDVSSIVQLPWSMLGTNPMEVLLTDVTGDGLDDLVLIKKKATGTNKTEVHILSAASGYKDIHWQYGTGCHVTDHEWQFVVNRPGRFLENRSVAPLGHVEMSPLLAIQKQHPSGKTELHSYFPIGSSDTLCAVDADLNAGPATSLLWQTVAVHATTELHATDNEWSFVPLRFAVGGGTDRLGAIDRKRGNKAEMTVLDIGQTLRMLERCNYSCDCNAVPGAPPKPFLAHHVGLSSEKSRLYGEIYYTAPPNPTSQQITSTVEFQQLSTVRTLNKFRDWVRARESESYRGESKIEKTVERIKYVNTWITEDKVQRVQEKVIETVPASYQMFNYQILWEFVRQHSPGNRYFQWEACAPKLITGYGRYEKPLSDGVIDKWWSFIERAIQDRNPETGTPEGLDRNASIGAGNQWRCSLYDVEKFVTRMKVCGMDKMAMISDLSAVVEGRAPGRHKDWSDFVMSKYAVITTRQAFWSVAHALDGRDLETGAKVR